MSARGKCPQCGAEMPNKALEGLCPDCLGKLAIGDVRAGEPLLAPFQHADEITAADFSADGMRLVTVSLQFVMFRQHENRLWGAPDAFPSFSADGRAWWTAAEP